jgi:hypothetical protein
MEEKVATWDIGDSYQQDIVGGTILLLLIAQCMVFGRKRVYFLNSLIGVN